MRELGRRPKDRVESRGRLRGHEAQVLKLRFLPASCGFSICLSLRLQLEPFLDQPQAQMYPGNGNGFDDPPPYEPAAAHC